MRRGVDRHEPAARFEIAVLERFLQRRLKCLRQRTSPGVPVTKDLRQDGAHLAITQLEKVQ